jgi:predicted short-subunit dehydrogenase-like oxidoreductase (DUF2520 family)
MKKPLPVSLLCAGKLTDTAITRFSGLRPVLGPIKSTSLRLASRYANMLRAGHAVESYETLGTCKLILIAVPDSAVAETVRELSRADLDWPSMTVALCSTDLDCSSLEPLADLGASTASICEAVGMDDRLFIVEADRSVIAQIQSVIADRRSKVVAVPPGKKTFWLAAAACTGPLLTDLLTHAKENLRKAVIPAADTANILQRDIEKTLRSFTKRHGKRPKPATLSKILANQ